MRRTLFRDLRQVELEQPDVTVHPSVQKLRLPKRVRRLAHDCDKHFDVLLASQ